MPQMSCWYPQGSGSLRLIRGGPTNNAPNLDAETADSHDEHIQIQVRLIVTHAGQQEVVLAVGAPTDSERVS